jgi:polysaccharide export outer membrane protein
MKVCLLLTMIVSSFAQVQAPRPATEPVIANLPLQKIGPNDLIAVSVYDSPELTRTVRVDGDGNIRLPMLRGAVSAAGRMPAELEQALAQALVDEKLIVNPFVTVTVAEYSSRPISVSGSVKTPLTFQATGPVTLLEALTRAGGVTADAGNEILISRKADASRPSAGLLQRVSVKSLMEKGEAGANLELTAGKRCASRKPVKSMSSETCKRPGRSRCRAIRRPRFSRPWRWRRG